MSFTTILNKATLSASSMTALDGTPVTLPAPPGSYILWSSSKFNVPNGVEGLEVLVKFENNFASATDGVPVNYNISAILETEDSAGNWHPIHGMIEAFQGSQPRTNQSSRLHVLSYGPSISPVDSPFDVTAGGITISRDHRKQGRMPDDFRVCLLLDENRSAGDPGQFSSIDVTISYSI